MVLEQLPKSWTSGANEIAEWKHQLEMDPVDEAAASALATRYLQMGHESGDPRFFGFAQSILVPWWTDDRPPISILRLRAELHEAQHSYNLAIKDLSQILETDATDAQSRIEMINLLRIRGRYSEAEVACVELATRAGSLSSVIGHAPLLAVTGKAKSAERALQSIPNRVRELNSGVYSWLLSMRAEVARILDQPNIAEQHLRDALQHNPQDRAATRFLADLLLDDGRFEEVLALTKPFTQDNGILLRRAIAAKRSRDAALSRRLRDELFQRFAEVRLRGDLPHLRYETRFALEIEEDPARALELGLQNWERQKEARDCRNVLEAAAAQGDLEAVRPVIDFIRQHRTEDPTLLRLIQKLEA